MSWTQPICGKCYAAKEPHRTPVTVRAEDREPGVRCCFCGERTEEGIWYRADPRKVLYPAPYPDSEEA